MPVNASTRPLGAAALALVAGMALAAWVEVKPQPPPWSSGVLLLLAALGLRQRQLRLASATLILSAALLGIQFRARAEALYPGPRILERAAHTPAGLPTELSGVLLRDPEPRPTGWTLLVELESLGGAPAGGQLTLWLPPGPPPAHRTGTRIQTAARLAAPRRYGNPGAPDFAAILRSQGLAGSASIKSALLVEDLGPAAGHRTAQLAAWLRGGLLHGLDRALEPLGPQATRWRGLLAAILVGVRGGMEEEDLTVLRRSGLFHLVAISGLHFSILLGAAWWMLRRLRSPTRAACVTVAAFAALYALAAGGRSSVGRAAWMALLMLVGRFLSVELDPTNAVGLAGLVLLIHDPLQLDNRGFQLTFAATLALLRLYPLWRPALPRRPDLFWSAACVSIAAFAGVQPLIAFAFQRASPIGLLLNLAAVPLFGLITLLGWIAAAAPLLPGIGTWAATAAAQLLDGMLALAAAAADLPGASYRVAAPSALQLALVYASLTGCSSARGRLARRIAAVVALALLLQISLPPQPRAGDGRLHLHAVDVGQGDSLIARLPDGRSLLVDGGGLRGSSLDIGDAVLGPLLARLGIAQLEVVALSHAHTDHLQGLLAIARDFPIGRVWQPESPPRTPGFAELAALLRRRGVGLLSLTRGYRERIGAVEIEVLHPPRGASDRYRVRNNDSQVLRLRFGRTAFLLTGDIESGAELQLAAQDQAQAAVLKIPHHGSRTSSSDLFLAAVRPRWAILSVAERNPFGFPRPEVLERYRRHRVRLVRTDRHGMVSLVSDGFRVSVETFYPVSVGP